MPASPVAYSAAQKALHWTMAALILGMIPVGLTMTRLGDGPLKNTLYELHKSFGLVVITLAVIRLAVRLRHGAPPLVPGLPAWQRRAATASHHLLYALIFITPLTGWLGTSACCAPVNLFWQVPLTLPVGGGFDAAKVIFAVHNAAAVLLALIAAVHVGAALMHHFVRRDETLVRMLPGQTATLPDAAPSAR